MKKILFIAWCIWWFNCSSILSQVRRDFNFKFDGADRNFVLAVPSGAVPAGGYPLVMMLHGTSGDGEKFYFISGWKELGEREKFITVFPSSLEFCFIGPAGFKTLTTKWNNGEAQSVKCPGLVQDFKDDVKFIRKVLDTVKNLYPINNSKIYISGFSNGSVMANKLAVEMSDVFAAAASSGGLLSPADSAKPKRYIPIWETIGTHDVFLIDAIGRPLPFNDSLDLYVVEATRIFRGVANLANKYRLIKTNNTYTYIYEQPNDAKQRNYLYYTYLKDMEHVYPNNVNYPFSAATQYWEFFKQASAISTPIKQHAQDHIGVSIYPNPAHTLLTLTMPDYQRGRQGELLIYDVVGKLKLKASIQQETTQIDVSTLTPGIYFAYLPAPHGIEVKNIVIR